MAGYINQLKTFQREESNQELQRQGQFKEAIKEYIDKNHYTSQMKFDTFVKDYLDRRRRKRGKLKEIIEGKTAGIMYEEYEMKKDIESSSVKAYPLIDKSEDLKNILDDDKLWTLDTYADNEVSASEAFDQWMNNLDEKAVSDVRDDESDKLVSSLEQIRIVHREPSGRNDRHNVDQKVVIENDKVIGETDGDLYSFSKPSSSAKVTLRPFVSIRNADRGIIWRRKEPEYTPTHDLDLGSKENRQDSKLFPNFQVNFDSGVANDWNFKNIWESKKDSRNILENEDISITFDQKNKKTSKYKSNPLKVIMEQEKTTTRTSLSEFFSWDEHFRERPKTSRPFYQAEEKTKQDVIPLKLNDIIKNRWEEDFQHSNIANEYSERFEPKKQITEDVHKENELSKYPYFPFTYRQYFGINPNVSAQQDSKVSAQIDKDITMNQMKNRKKVPLRSKNHKENKIESYRKIPSIDRETDNETKQVGIRADTNIETWSNVDNSWKPITGETVSDKPKPFSSKPQTYIKYPMKKNKQSLNKRRHPNKNKLHKFLRKPITRRKQFFQPKNMLSPFHRTTNLPQWRRISHQHKSGSPTRIQTRSGSTFGDWNSPVVDNLLKAMLPLGSLALAVGSYLPSAARGRRDLGEEELDRAKVKLEHHIYNFEQKYRL